MPHQHYMKLDILQFYYSKIKDKKSLENDVDNFWNTLLPTYFKAELMYGIEQESRPNKDLGQRADFTIRYIKNGEPKKVILMEDKRKGLETQTSQWALALEQLTRYMSLVRTEQDENQILYGAINIGTYTRFYQLNPKTPDCIDYPGTDGKYYELVDNEDEIHEILVGLVEKTKH